MEPRYPSFALEPDPEEPIEVTDYYEAARIGWVSADGDEAFESDQPPFEPEEE